MPRKTTKTTTARRKPPTHEEDLVANKRERGEGTADDMRTSVEKIRETLNDPVARLAALIVAVALLFFTVQDIKADVSTIEPRVARLAAKVANNDARLDELERIDRRITLLDRKVERVSEHLDGLDGSLEKITEAIKRAIRDAARNARVASGR